MPDIAVEQGIEKLALTSTFISGKNIVQMVERLPKLKILTLGALGSGPNASSSASNSSAMTLSDDILRGLTDALQACPELENVNLVQNTKLGLIKTRDSSIAYFIRLVGRRCKVSVDDRRL